MGSPLGPLMANTFMCSVEEKLKLRDKLPSYYKRYVDDTLTVMKDEVSAYSFLHVLNDLHPSISFTMELPTENTLPFLGMVLTKDHAAKVFQRPLTHQDIFKIQNGTRPT